MEEALWYRNHFFTDGQTDEQTDRQTDKVKPVYLARVYKRNFNVDKSLKNPGGQNFMEGVTFSRPLFNNLM